MNDTGGQPLQDFNKWALAFGGLWFLLLFFADQEATAELAAAFAVVIATAVTFQPNSPLIDLLKSQGWVKGGSNGS
jgi:hypothetical protein